MTSHRGIYLSELPLLIPALTLGAGIWIAVTIGGWLLFSIGGAAIAVAILGVILRNPKIATAAVVLLCGLLLGKVNISSTLDNAYYSNLDGEIVDARDYGSGYRLIIRNLRDDKNYLLYLSDVDYELMAGDRVKVAGISHSPFSDTTVPDELNNHTFVRLHRIYAELSYPEDFQLVKEAEGWKHFPEKSQRYLCDCLDNAGLQPSSSQFLKAVLLGKTDVDGEMRRDFSNSGLSHVLALSGTHIATISLFIAFLFFPLLLAGGRRVGVIITICILWVYAVITGLSPSVVRAVIMISIIGVGELTGRNPNSLNSLCGAGLLILLFSPLSILNIGFQLSFLAVAGIVAFLPLLMSIVDKTSKKIRKAILVLLSPVFLSISAMIGTGPLSVYYFHLFPAWFVVSNLLIGLLLPLILIIGIVILIFSFVGGSPAWLATVENWLIQSVVNLGGYFAELQPDQFTGLYPTLLSTILCYVAIFLLYHAWAKRRMVGVYASAVVLVALGLIEICDSVKYPDKELYQWNGTGRSYDLVYRNGNDVYILTDADPKHQGELLAFARFRLIDFLGKRDARLRGVATKDSHIGGMVISENFWVVDERTYLLLDDDSWQIDPRVRCWYQQLKPQVVVITKGFKGDPKLVREYFPQSEIVVSRAMYPVRRKEIIKDLAE